MYYLSVYYANYRFLKHNSSISTSGTSTGAAEKASSLLQSPSNMNSRSDETAYNRPILAGRIQESLSIVGASSQQPHHVSLSHLSAEPSCSCPVRPCNHRPQLSSNNCNLPTSTHLKTTTKHSDASDAVRIEDSFNTLRVSSPHSSGSIGPHPQPLVMLRSCREEAAACANCFDDTTVDDLAGYLDEIMFLPKPMSEMAELMYT